MKKIIGITLSALLISSGSIRAEEEASLAAFEPFVSVTEEEQRLLKALAEQVDAEHLPYLQRCCNRMEQDHKTLALADVVGCDQELSVLLQHADDSFKESDVACIMNELHERFSSSNVQYRLMISAAPSAGGLITIKDNVCIMDGKKLQVNTIEPKADTDLCINLESGKKLKVDRIGAKADGGDPAITFCNDISMSGNDIFNVGTVMAGTVNANDVCINMGKLLTDAIGSKDRPEVKFCNRIDMNEKDILNVKLLRADEIGVSCINGPSGLVGVEPGNKLLVNEINPVKILDGKCVENPNGTTKFSGDVCIAADKKLQLNTIEPKTDQDLCINLDLEKKLKVDRIGEKTPNANIVFCNNIDMGLNDISGAIDITATNVIATSLSALDISALDITATGKLFTDAIGENTMDAKTTFCNDIDMNGNDICNAGTVNADEVIAGTRVRVAPGGNLRTDEIRSETANAKVKFSNDIDMDGNDICNASSLSITSGGILSTNRVFPALGSVVEFSQNVTLIGGDLFMNGNDISMGGGDILSACTVNAVTFMVISDETIKENVQSIPTKESLEKIKQLSPRTFTLKIAPELGTQRGLIAQEVESVLPEYVSVVPEFTVGDETYENLHVLNYPQMVTDLIGALQASQAQVESLDDDVKLLQEQMAAVLAAA